MRSVRDLAPTLRRRGTLVLLGAVLVLVVLVFVGRWERSRHADAQNARMEAIFRVATSGGLISSRLDAYRLDTAFDCLLYRAPHGTPVGAFALELCFDPQGRLVEAIDRRTDNPVIGSLQEQPSLARIHLPVSRLLAAFTAVGAFHDPRLAGVSARRSTLPVGFSDEGATRAKVD